MAENFQIPPHVPNRAVMKCAVWYLTYGSALYELCSDERDAAIEAHEIEETEIGSVVGVQFEDGWYVPRGEWLEYKAEAARREQRLADEIQLRASWPKLDTRWIAAPFDPQKKVEVLTTAPAWLGSPVASR